MLSLSGPKTRLLLQLLIPLVNWSVVNVTAEVNDYRLISLDTNRVSREEVCLPSRDCLVLSVNLPSIALIVLHSFVGSVL